MNLDNILKELKEKEEAKLAAMTPEERAQWEKHKLEKQEKWEAYQAHLAEKVTLTRGEILEQETLTEQAHEQELERTFKDTLKEAAKAVKPIITSARTSQSGTDRALTKALARIKELEQRQITTDADGFEVEEVITDNGEARLTDEELKAELPPEIIAQILAERTADARRQKAKHATSSQSGTDSKLTKALAKIKELEAEVAELKRQRDELLDRLTAATGAKVIA